MQGLYVNGRRPKSKKAVREAIADGERVTVEATSIFGNEFDGNVLDLPGGERVYFAGPDPYTKRNFYGSIEWVNGKLRVK